SPNFGPAMWSPDFPLFVRHLGLTLVLSSVIILWRCAAEKPPPGGPLDTDGPQVMRVEPPSGTTDLAPDQEIVITFDELVDPVSVPGSMVFTPPLDFTTRVRSRRVTIRPAEPFQDGRPYVLTLQRGIRDYRKNSIPQSYQLVFSTGGQIPTGRIEGWVTESDPEQYMEVGLFREADSGYALVQTVDLALDGTFTFDYLSDGTYRVAAVEGGLSDFPEALHRRPYALPPLDSLVVQGNSASVVMRRSPPLAQPQIRSVEWITPTYMSITFDTPFGEAPLPQNLYPTDDPTVYGYIVEDVSEDTTVVDLGEGYTQLGEPYRLEPLATLSPSLEDTVPPEITVPNRRLALVPDGEDAVAGRYEVVRGRINFSEPVHLPPGLTARLTGQDTLVIPMVQVNPLMAVLEVLEPERFERAAFLGEEITDVAGNTMKDSLVNLTLVYTPPLAAGSIRGRLEEIKRRVVVETRDSETGELRAHTVTDSAAYYLSAVPPGFYYLFAHEQVGAYPVPYYSGRWEPYHRAARFGYHWEVEEVRPRWEVDGIDINFRVAISHNPAYDSDTERD
ncbi:MAG: Ig-like domain-containing protein, partial [Fidelibacterota bacterium]